MSAPLILFALFSGYLGQQGSNSPRQLWHNGFRVEDDGNFGLPFLPEWKTHVKPIVPQRGNPAKMEDARFCRESVVAEPKTGRNRGQRSPMRPVRDGTTAAASPVPSRVSVPLGATLGSDLEPG